MPVRPQNWLNSKAAKGLMENEVKVDVMAGPPKNCRLKRELRQANNLHVLPNISYHANIVP